MRCVLSDPVEIRLYGAAERGEGDERLALKKCAAQLTLQRYDGVGQRGLGDAAAPGRSREIALLAERQEVADLVHLHGSTSRDQRSRGSLPSTSAFDGEVLHRAALFVADVFPVRSEEHTSELQSLTNLVSLPSFPTRRSSDLGLGDAAAPGRSREIALLAERQEVADLVHLHGSTSRDQRSRGSLPSTSAFDGEVLHRAALFVADVFPV